ncbi:Mitochondrial ribosomal protein L55 [Chamberlinius hualienensis]
MNFTKTNVSYVGSSKVIARSFNSHTASIGKVGRQTYTRLYPTLLVNPDGSTITIRYHLPQRIIKLPIDVSKLSEDELRAQLERRKPKERVVIEEEIEDEFNEANYSHLWKN